MLPTYVPFSSATKNRSMLVSASSPLTNWARTSRHQYSIRSAYSASGGSSARTINSSPVFNMALRTRSALLIASAILAQGGSDIESADLLHYQCHFHPGFTLAIRDAQIAVEQRQLDR